jgi:nicotinamide mononucleotide transporter
MSISLWIPESVGAILTVWCVYLATQNKIANWPISILASIVYFYVFYQNHFFSDAYLQLVFVLFQLYGWWFWSKLNPSKQQQQISKIDRKSIIFLTIISVLLYGIWLHFYKIINPTARIPEVDALTTIISLTALYMQAKRWVENWIIWVIVDIIYVPMYIYGEQHITACLYGFLAIMAIYGFKEWQKQKTLDHSNKA